jgi:hypothetical protein
MPAKELVYLDFDGVLHPASPVMGDLFSRAYLLEPIVEKTDLQIVISSSWRFTHSLEKLQRSLPTSIGQLVIGTTSSAIIGKYPRFQEIQNYLTTHGTADWRALDDSYWEFPSPCPTLIRCNPNTGVSDKQILELQQWLGKP